MNCIQAINVALYAFAIPPKTFINSVLGLLILMFIVIMFNPNNKVKSE